MSSPDVPDASEIDELASALVDGEATGAERARAGEPEVAGRVAAFEQVARLVATPVEPVDDLARTRAIRAALAAAAPAPPVRRMPTWLAPAAAVIVVLAGFGLFVAAIAGSSSDGEDSAASSGADTATEATAEGEAGGGGGESFEESSGDVAGGATAEAPASTLADGDLGAFDSPPELADALRVRFDREPTADDGAQRSARLDAAGCSGAFEASTVLDVTTATLNGRPVLVVVLQRADGRLSYAAVAEPTCETLAAGDL